MPDKGAHKVHIKVDDAYDALPGMRMQKIERIAWWRDRFEDVELLTLVYRVRYDQIHPGFNEVRLDLFADGKHKIGTIIKSEFDGS